MEGGTLTPTVGISDGWTTYTTHPKLNNVDPFRNTLTDTDNRLEEKKLNGLGEVKYRYLGVQLARPTDPSPDG